MWGVVIVVVALEATQTSFLIMKIIRKLSTIKFNHSVVTKNYTSPKKRCFVQELNTKLHQTLTELNKP